MATGGEPPKKDLTSILELSALELANNPTGVNEKGEGGYLQDIPIEKVTEADFGDLESLSQAAASADPVPETPPPAAADPLPPAQLEPEQIAELQAAVETPPGESPSSASLAPGLSAPDAHSSIEGIPGLGGSGGDSPSVTTEQPSSFDLPSHSQMSPSEGSTEAPPAEHAAPAAAGDSSAAIAMPTPDVTEIPLSGADMSALSPVHTQQSQAAAPTGESVVSEPPSVAEVSMPAPSAQPVLRQPIDPNRPPVNAPPAGSSHAHKGEAPSPQKQDLSEVKKFGEKLAIGRPKLDAVPAFSLLVVSPTGRFDDKQRKAIEDAITSEDFGIRIEEISIQLDAGKLLVPQISEFAAITLAQKLRDVVESIEVDLAGEIFKSSVGEISGADDSFLMDVEEFEQSHEEVHDMGAEPRNAEDLFSSNLPEVSEYQVTRILSAVMASEIVNAEVAENRSSKEFEVVTEKLTGELINRAFKLGAHGVLGISFTLRAIEGYKDETGKVRRAYRMLGTGTAVRARRRSGPTTPSA